MKNKTGYSRVVKCDGKLFRYNYDRGLVEYVIKPPKNASADNEEWMREFGHPLWDIKNGYVVLDEVGLSYNNWKDAEARESYLINYSDDLDEEMAWLMRWD